MMGALNHTVQGPDEAGEFHLVYTTAAVAAFTQVSVFRVRERALEHAAILNAAQADPAGPRSAGTGAAQGKE